MKQFFNYLGVDRVRTQQAQTSFVHILITLNVYLKNIQCLQSLTDIQFDAKHEETCRCKMHNRLCKGADEQPKGINHLLFSNFCLLSVKISKLCKTTSAVLLTRVEVKLHYKHFMVKGLLQFFQSVKSRVHGCTSHLADECGLELGSSIAGVKKLGEGHLQK